MVGTTGHKTQIPIELSRLRSVMENANSCSEEPARDARRRVRTRLSGRHNGWPIDTAALHGSPPRTPTFRRSTTPPGRTVRAAGRPASTARAISATTRAQPARKPPHPRSPGQNGGAADRPRHRGDRFVRTGHRAAPGRHARGRRDRSVGSVVGRRGLTSLTFTPVEPNNRDTSPSRPATPTT